MRNQKLQGTACDKHCQRRIYKRSDCCDPTLSVLVMLVSRNVYHAVSALQSIACLHTFFWLIRSLVDPTLAVFIVCGPLQFLVSVQSPASPPATVGERLNRSTNAEHCHQNKSYL